MKTFYHGSPTSGLEVLQPRHDERLGIEGVFVADEPFGPMLFALLPARAHADVQYETKDGKFVRGSVVTPAMNDEGWLYTLEAEEGTIKESSPGEFHLSAPARVIKSERVTKDDVSRLGWTIVIKKTQ